jgi:hypothetical protein
MYVAILLIAISLISIQVGAYYDLERFFLSSNSAAQNTGSHRSDGSGNNTDTHVIQVNALLNFGNGTSKWFNESRVPIGWNFYNLTLYVANNNVESTYYSGLNEHYITAIDGKSQPRDGSFFWHLWQFCNKDQAWSYSNVGADEIILSNGQSAAWYFDSSSNYGSPVPGSRTVVTCS